MPHLTQQLLLPFLLHVQKKALPLYASTFLAVESIKSRK